MRANSLRTNAAAGQGGGIRAATCYEAYSGFGGKPMRNLAHQSERPFLRPRMAQVTCPSTTVVVKVSRTPALRSRQPRSWWRASWKAPGVTRGWLALYGDLKRTPGSTVAKDSACVCIVRIETERRVWV